jgi:hypothetical protein
MCMAPSQRRRSRRLKSIKFREIYTKGHPFVAVTHTQVPADYTETDKGISEKCYACNPFRDLGEFDRLRDRSSLGGIRLAVTERIAR